jgi:hypothetical protein
MTVEPTASMGWVEGTVRDLRTGEPLAASLIAYGQPYSVTSNAESGVYQFWLEQGNHTIEISAPGYVSQVVEVEITAQQGITQDFALLLDAPLIQVFPDFISATQPMGTQSNHTVTISNTGSSTLTFEILPPGLDPTGIVLWMHFDEPGGSTEFLDFSGYDNHGSCSGDSCPVGGNDGHKSTSLFFDGTNDYIVVPDSPSLNPRDAIAVSAWIHPEIHEGNWNRRIVQKGPSDNQYIFNALHRNADIVLLFELEGVGYVLADLPNPGTWHHVVGLYDGSVIQIWADGFLIGETAASGNIATTSNPLYIGTKYPGAPLGDHFYGLMDEVMIFDRSLSQTEILSLYNQGLENLQWLSVDPISGTLSNDSAQIIQVTLDAEELQQGIFTTDLYIDNNDPLNPIITIPITLTVGSGGNKVYLPLIAKDSAHETPETSSTWNDGFIVFTGLSGLILLGWLGSSNTRMKTLITGLTMRQIRSNLKSDSRSIFSKE